MKTPYEFRCDGCGQTVMMSDRLATTHETNGSCTEHLPPGSPGGCVHSSAFCDAHYGGVCGWDKRVECGPLRRVWSFGIAWPKSQRGH